MQVAAGDDGAWVGPELSGMAGLVALSDALAAGRAQIALANHQTQEQVIRTLDGACDTLSFLGSSQAVVDCAKIPTMPTVTFTIAGKAFDLTPEQYVLKACPTGFTAVHRSPRCACRASMRQSAPAAAEGALSACAAACTLGANTAVSCGPDGRAPLAGKRRGLCCRHAATAMSGAAKLPPWPHAPHSAAVGDAAVLSALEGFAAGCRGRAASAGGGLPALPAHGCQWYARVAAGVGLRLHDQ